jgi:hypothetical protein
MGMVMVMVVLMVMMMVMVMVMIMWPVVLHVLQYFNGPPSTSALPDM